VGAWENVVEISREARAPGEARSHRVYALTFEMRAGKFNDYPPPLIDFNPFYDDTLCSRGTRNDAYRPKPPLSEIQKPRVHVRSSVSCLVPIRIARDSTRSRIPSNESPFPESLSRVRSFLVARNADRVPLLHIHFVTRVLKIINCRLYSERKTPVS